MCQESVEFDRYHMSRASQLLLASVLLLVGIGLVFVFSASAYRAERYYQTPMYFLYSQTRGVALGCMALLVVSFMHPKMWIRWAPWLAAACFAALVLVLFQADSKGASRWLRFGGLTIQPSEFAKIAIPALIAWCAHKYKFYHASKEELASGGYLESWRGQFRQERGQRIFFRLSQLVVLAMFVGVIAIEPDLGTAAFIGAISFLLLLVTRLHWLWIALTALATLPAGYVLYSMRPKEISQRLLGLTDPQKVEQVWQSLMGIGSGGLWGKGLGYGSTGLQHLPEAHNDFIFAVIAEETGLMGVAIIILLFSVLLQAGYRIVRDCPHAALRIFALGLVLNLICQAIFNLLVTTAWAPTKGIGLPFLSFGSTSLTVALLEVGILISISRLRGPGPSVAASDQDNKSFEAEPA